MAWLTGSFEGEIAPAGRRHAWPLAAALAALLLGAASIQKAFSETDFTEDLKKFDVPTLVLHGEDDQIVPVRNSAMKSARLIKGAKDVYYPSAPHGLTRASFTVGASKSQVFSEPSSFTRYELDEHRPRLPIAGMREAPQPSARAGCRLGGHWTLFGRGPPTPPGARDVATALHADCVTLVLGDRWGKDPQPLGEKLCRLRALEE